MEPDRKKRLTKKTDEEIRSGAAMDPENPILNEKELSRFKPSVNVKRIRLALKMSQSEFARVYHLTLSTIKDWEQGRTIPDQSSKTLLSLIEKAPKIIADMLNNDSSQLEFS
jgi:putative transcriptional regulator